MKFLSTIRFDPSDEKVFEQPAGPDEWAIPGGFAFAGLDPDAIAGKTRQAFANGFLSLESFGRSTFASVAEITRAELDRLAEALATHLEAAHGAPDRAAALAAARGEIDFVLDLCREVPVNTVFTLRRHFDAAGEMREEFRTITPPKGPIHGRVWAIVDDEETADGRAGG